MPMYLPALLHADGVGQQLLDRRVTLVEQVRDDPGVAVQAQGQLGQVVGADGEAVEELEELSARMALDGSSHIMITRRPFSPRFRPFSASRSTTWLGFAQGAHERHHDFDVGQAHLVAHALQARHSSSKQSRKIR
jgi:hypothetical protein